MATLKAVEPVPTPNPAAETPAPAAAQETRPAVRPPLRPIGSSARLPLTINPLNLDRMVHAAMGRVSQGLSPASLMLAFFDWASHLAISPGKQLELAENAWRKAERMVHYGMHAMTPGHPLPIEPLPQDQRFKADAWQQWPFNVIHQAFLFNEQWWHYATTGVRGVSRHHEEVVSFVARQMLDMVSPTIFPWTNPEITEATVKQGGVNLLHGFYNWHNDWLDSVGGVQRLPEGSENFVVGRDVAITPGKVVYRNDLIELIQYSPATETVYAEPVLIVPSWIMKYYILDLSPQNSLVRYLVSQGHTVFMISWRNPDAIDRNYSMDDYLNFGPLSAIDTVSRLVPDRPIHAAGYCLGGTLLAIAASALARENDTRIQTLSLFAAEVDFEEPGELSLFIDESQVAYLEDIMWDRGYLEGPQMSGAFQLLNSRDLVWSKMVRQYLMGTRQPVNDLMAWNADATRMPYRMHSEYLHTLYLNNDLAGGRYLVKGRPVALTDIRAPVFTVATEKDHVAPWKSVYKIHILTDTDITFVLTTGGHNAGIVSEPGHGRRSYRIRTSGSTDQYLDPEMWLATADRKEGSWWLAWHDWMSARSSGEKVAPPPTGARDKGLPALADAPGTYVLIP